MIVDYYNVFRNLIKAFASYGGGSIGEGEGKTEDTPVQEKDQLYVLLDDTINECSTWCTSMGVDLNQIQESNMLFSKLGLFDEYADVILGSDENKKQYIVL